MNSESTVQELQEAIEEIKDRWQRGDTLEMPEPIERARSLARDLENDGSTAATTHGHQGTVTVHDHIEFESVLESVREHATETFSPLPDGTTVGPDEWEIDRCIIEDCVVYYRVDHPESPVKSEVEEFAV